MVTQNKKKILLVEDETKISDLYKLKLKEAGYIVNSVDTPDDGLKKAVGGKYDLIILDILLPQYTGLELLRKMREKGILKKSRVAMITNYAQQENLNSAYGLGAEEVFVKYKMTPDELKTRIKQLLSRQKSDSPRIANSGPK